MGPATSPHRPLRDTLVRDALAYRKTLQRLAAGRIGFEYAGRREAFAEALPVLDESLEKHLEGRDSFERHKFSEEFRQELAALYGGRGERIFEAWAVEACFELRTDGRALIASENGDFGDSFYSGSVKGAYSCVEHSLTGFHVAAITGFIELPWTKQFVVTAPGETEFIYRARLYLMDGGGDVVLLVQPRYHAAGLPAAGRFRAECRRSLERRYGGLLEIREMPQAMLSRETKTDEYPQGINSGYRTFRSGRAPFFYLDSNCHAWRLNGEIAAKNGLHSRFAGQSVEFPRGWASEFELAPDSSA